LRAQATQTTQLTWTASGDGLVGGDIYQWCNYTGQKEETVQDWGWLEALHADDRKKVRQRWHQATVTRRLYEIPLHILSHDDGMYHTFRAKYVPVFEDDGSNIREWISWITNVDTEPSPPDQRKITHFSLDYLIFEQAPVGIACTSLDGRLIRVNKQICNISGYAPDELLNKRFFDFYYPEDVAAGYTLLRWLLQDKEQYHITEQRVRHKNGNALWTSITVSLLKFPSGEPLYFLSVFEDITRRKQEEEERRSLQEREQIERRQQERYIDDFLGLASHEMRTPLTSIKGNIQLALRRLEALKHLKATSTQALLNSLQRIQQPLEHAIQRAGVQDRMISELLDASRIRANRLVYIIRPCNLLEIVRNVVQDTRQAVPDRTIRLDLPSVETVPLMADADRIGQVVHNYISNAIKYSPPEQPVDVSLQIEDRIARVSVQDRGQGLQPEEQKHVWERFYRAPNVNVEHDLGAGLGLGLYICHTIIEHHHGQVGLQSAPGKGSIFWFTLPVSACKEGQNTDSHSEISGG
jgi:PAS domain S-box-containing protein